MTLLLSLSVHVAVADISALHSLSFGAHRSLLDTSTGPVPATSPAASTKSNVIPSAGEAELTNGIGDLNPKGACEGDIAAFCKEYGPGEGRLAACIAARLKDQKKGNVAGRKVSDKCIKDLDSFNIDVSSNINKDVILARACKDDAVKLCSTLSDVDSPGSVIGCLRDNKDKLDPACKGEVFRVQSQVAADWRMDHKLYQACESQVEQLCKDVTPGEGRELECLINKRPSVSWGCNEEVMKFQKQAGDDIRLSTRLFVACMNDAKRYCKNVEPGHMRMQECLEDHSDKADFSSGCKRELDAIIAQRVAEFTLDTALQEACEDDLQELCKVTVKEMTAPTEGGEAKRDMGLNCLQQYKEDLAGEKCRAEVHRRMVRASRDIRFDDQLAKACMDDRARHCQDIQPGSARVIRCLQEHSANLSARCSAALFDHEVKMAEDIDFKYPMRKACSREMALLCKDVPHGHAKVIRCLEQHLESSDMSRECKEEVTRDMNRMAQDYRLNWRLNNACKADINTLCADICNPGSGQPCGGLVLQCLQQKQDNITASACQEEVFYYQLMEVTDFRNDVILAEACRNDVEKYCKDVEPGEGRVHQCLRFHREFISEPCRNEENKLSQVEYRDIRLRPKLNKLCSEERAVYCKDVKPGRARVVRCLVENMAQPNFGEECKIELRKREDAVKSDYRLDVGVFTNCQADVDRLCAAAKAKLRGNATVLLCLADNFVDTDDACQSEMSRAVRLALWDYRPATGLTQVCDQDVTAFCPKGATRRRSSGVFTIGAIGRCLSRALVEGKPLQPKCRELVLIAAPKDARSLYFEYPESRSALVQRLAGMQRAAGLESVLVDPYARTGSGVTVTGWVALACIASIVLVGIGGMIAAYRRLTGADRPHTTYVRVGDD